MGIEKNLHTVSIPPTFHSEICSVNLLIFFEPIAGSVVNVLITSRKHVFSQKDMAINHQSDLSRPDETAWGCLFIMHIYIRDMYMYSTCAYVYIYI